MNIISNIKGFFMNLFSKFGIENWEDLKISELLSDNMQNAINLWLAMAQGKASWNIEYKPSGVIPTIVGAISDPVSEEIVIASGNKELEKIMQKVDSRIPEIVHNMVTVGGCLVRPVYSDGTITAEIIKLGYYIPTHYSLDGTLTGAVIFKSIEDGNKKFLLLENHEFEKKLIEDKTIGVHSVSLKLYRIDGGHFYKVDLSSCSKTRDLTETYEWLDVDRPFIVEFRNPKANETDNSNIPTAIYAGHENLIEDCDRQYQEINIEQINGRSVVFADEDMFRERMDASGKKKKVMLSRALHRLIVKINGNGLSEQKIQTHSPALRTEQQIAAYTQILKEIENVCRLGKGTLSNLQEVVQTATQYKGGKSVLYNTVDVYESEIENKYKELAYIFAYMLAVYNDIPFDDEITITYDESDRKDASMQRMEDMQEVTQGIMRKDEYRMKHYGESAEEARANLPEQETDNYMMKI